jgi:threonine/homoserine/homoserine lactone efflux protein
MDLLPILTFAGVYALAVASPGPSIAALVARTMATGGRGVAGFCAGLVAGDLVWLMASAFGVAALAAMFQPLFLLLKWAGVAFLVWMAWQLWTAPARAIEDMPPAPTSTRSFAAGLMLALGNPKTMLFFVALLPTLLPLDRLSLATIGALALTAAAVMSLILAAYAVLTLRLRDRLKSARAVRAVNRTSGLLLAGAAAAIATRA